MSLDSLFDTELDDLADLPSFAVPPAGSYIAIIKSWEPKEIASHPAWEVTFKISSVAELVDVNATPPEAGTECSVAYFMDNEIGEGRYKEICAPFAAHYGTGRMRDLVPQIIGTEVLVTTKVRKNKEKTQDYLDVVSVMVV